MAQHVALRVTSGRTHMRAVIAGRKSRKKEAGSREGGLHAGMRKSASSCWRHTVA